MRDSRLVGARNTGTKDPDPKLCYTASFPSSPSPSPSNPLSLSHSLYVCVRVFACVTVQGNIFGEYFKFARTVLVLVPMHRIAPHYCIVALECLISCLGARTKRVITRQRDGQLITRRDSSSSPNAHEGCILHRNFTS